MLDIVEIKSLIKPGDADMVDGVACALTFNPCWSKHIEVLTRIIRLVYMIEHDEDANEAP